MDCELKDNSTRSLNDEIEIDILLKNNELRNPTKQLKIDNYSYDYDDNYLILHISCVLDEGGENTMNTKEKDNLTMDKVNSKIEPLRGELTSEEISDLEELFSRKDVEVISTFPKETVKEEKSIANKEEKESRSKTKEQVNNVNIDERKCSCEENNESNDIEKNNTNDDHEDEDNENVKEQIEPIIIEEELDEPIDAPNNIEDMIREKSMINVVKEPKKDNILVEEGYSIFATFYRVHEGDTYSSISLKHNCNEQKLMLLNNNMELKEGLLIRIPK